MKVDELNTQHSTFEIVLKLVDEQNKFHRNAEFSPEM